MFNVKNIAGGILCLDLEQGSINLANGQSINLEAYCSREWIDTNPGLRSILNKRVLMVVYDSASGGLPPVNLTSGVPRPPIVVSLPKKMAQNTINRPPKESHVREAYDEVIPNIPKPTSDTEPMVIDLKTNTVTPPKKSMVLEVAPVKDNKIKVKQVKPEKQYKEDELKKMYLGDVKVIAAGLGIDVNPPVSKAKLMAAILEKYKEVGK